MKLLGNRISVRQDKASNEVNGILVDQSKVILNTGIIVEVGDELTKEFEIGQKVMFEGSYSKINIDEELLVMKEDNIMAILL